MERQPVTSSLIRSVGYDLVGSILEIELVEPNRLYTFYDVPFSVYDELMERRRRARISTTSSGTCTRTRQPPTTGCRETTARRSPCSPRRTDEWIDAAGPARSESQSDSTRPSARAPGLIHRVRGESMIDWSKVFAEALPYGSFLDRYAGPGQRSRWDAMHGRFALSGEQRRSSAASRGGCRCSACAGRGAATASTSARTSIISRGRRRAIDLRFLDRDIKPEVREELSINGGHRVPVVVFLSEDGFEVSRYGERTLSTYRRMAAEYLGPSCPTGVVAAGRRGGRRGHRRLARRVRTRPAHPPPLAPAAGDARGLRADGASRWSRRGHTTMDVVHPSSAFPARGS